MHSVADAAAKKDVDQFMTYWANSDSTVYTRHGMTFVGWAEIRADHAKAFSGTDKWSADVSEQYIRVVSSSSGVVTAFNHLSSVAEDGTTQSTWFILTATVEQRSEGWKIIQAHSSYPGPGMTPLGGPQD